MPKAEMKNGGKQQPVTLPRHIAIIMDGNGRWAKRRGLPRVEGHRAGMQSVRRIVRKCNDLKIANLTLYAFSTENWKRPRLEIQFLMNLLVEYLRKELSELHHENVRIRRLGKREQVPVKVLACIDQAEAKTKGNTGLSLNLAFNYGGRQEILDAMAAYLKIRPRPVLNEKTFSRLLYTAELPDPDLLIRTSGEMRISNFLLWQLAYTEIVVMPVLWPDFKENDLLLAIAEFQKRERRFGGVEALHA